MVFGHHLKLWVPNPVDSAGTQDDVTGAWTPGLADTSVIFYDGDADVQETPRRTVYSAEREPRQYADATAFLAETDVFDVSHVLTVAAEQLRLKTNVYAEITWEDGAVEPAEVMAVRRLDGAVLLRRIG